MFPSGRAIDLKSGMAVANLLIVGVLLLTANHALAQDTAPPQVFNCPKEDIQGGFVSTTSGTSVAAWNNVVAYNVESPSSLASSERSLYGQTTTTQFPYGFTTVGYEFIDNPDPPGPANIALCTFFVAIPVMNDNSPPTVFCPTGATFNIASNSPSGLVTWVEPVPVDNNNIVRRTWRSHAPNTLFPPGDTQVTYRWIDPTNSAMPLACVFTITVSTLGTDGTVPSLVCPSDFKTTLGNPTWQVPIPTDPSGVLPVQGSHTPGGALPIGFTTVTYTVTDNTGNRASCSFVIKRSPGTDVYDPFITSCPQNMQQTTDSTTSLPAISWAVPTAYDDSGHTRLVMQTHTSGSTFPIGTTSVAYRFEDVEEKIVRCVFNVIVSIQNPCNPNPCMNSGTCSSSGATFSCTCTAQFTGNTCQTQVAQLLVTCPAGRNVAAADSQNIVLGQPTVTGAIGDVTYQYFVLTSTGSLTPLNNAVLSTGAPSLTTIAISAQDQSGRPPPFCTYQITVSAATDTVRPVLTGCPTGTITFEIPVGQTQTFVSWNIPTATDNVDPNPTLTPSRPAGIFTAGTYNIIYTARDASGNTATCSFNVQVNQGDPCNNINCQNGGACQVSGSTFICQCVNGYSGTFCATAPSGLQIFCSDTAVSGPAGSTQQVNLQQPTYTGTTVPMFFYLTSGGMVIPNSNAYPVTITASPTTETITVYGSVLGSNTQANCMIDITISLSGTTPCSSNPCVNGGGCNVNGNTYTCSCPAGYSGVNCELGPCNINCLNGGACQFSGSTFICQCVNGYSGTNCQNAPSGFQIVCRNIAVDGSPNTASIVALPQPTFSGSTTPTFIYTDSNGNTITNPGMFSVSAPQSGIVMVNVVVRGVVGNQQDICTTVVTVTVINPCLPNPCPPGEDCYFTGSVFLCKVPVGMAGRRRRSVDLLDLPGGVSVCDSHPCAHNGTCLSVMSPEIGEAMRCQCMLGWTGPTCLTELYEVELPGEHSPEVWSKEGMSVHWMMVAVIGILALVIMTMAVTFMRFLPRRTRTDDVKLIY